MTDAVKYVEKEAIATIVPSRSKYQLKNFVIGQHDTPQMQWRQVILEAQSLEYNIRQAKLSIELTELKIAELVKKGDAKSLIKAEKKRLGLILTQRTLAGAELEYEWLKEIAAEVGYFSYKEIEDNQPDYWAKRLTRQADIDRASRTEGISAGNLQSMLNAGLVEQTTKEVEK